MMIASLRRSSIAARLTWMNVLVSGIGLVLAYFSFLAYDLFVYRQACVENLAGLANVTGTNSVSSILFDDETSAEITLAALSGSSDVTSAGIYTTSGVRFAEYEREGALPSVPLPFPPNAIEANWVDGLNVVAGSRIESEGKEIGTVYIRARLQGVRRQAIQYATIAAMILLVCLGVALLVGIFFRKLLAEPIVSLAQTARDVSRSKDYALRFTPRQDFEELLSLTAAFNEMLGEIQQRDAALEKAKVELEIRVEERTAQLQAANLELEAFSYTVAHDLRSPLQAISNVCFLLGVMDQEGVSPQRKTMLAQLNSTVAVMSGMIDDLLDLSRSSTAELHLAKVDLGPIVATVLKGLADANTDRRVKTVVQSGCVVQADPGLIQIVLQNLIRNAWKFSGRRELAEIEFGCTQLDGKGVIFVRDNGAGFNPQLADRLFKPFHRLHGASEFPGTGIGLATVRRIVGRHGGRVWAEGEVDKGATFYFMLGTE
jgi:light-regulated signal transduction histidine kinase (bacteriophytochrome)